MKMPVCKLFSFFLAGIIFLSGCKEDEPVVNSPGFIPPATEDIVMYEINVNAFSATHDLQGVISRLDSIKQTGINTIWLMPVYPTGILNSFGSPYCVRNYTEVNENFGTLADLQQLVNTAHAMGIAVILDWVANHTAWDNAWISNTSWYTQDDAGNIISPEGTSWTDVADLNYDNADMRLAMIDAMQFWVDEADIDGFRCDAADYIPFDFWQQAIDSLQKNDKNLILLAEGSRADHFTAGFQMNYAWSFLTMLKNVFSSGTNAFALFNTNDMEYGALPAGGKKLRFITNHDESNIATPATVYGSNNAALAAFVIACCLQGVPLIYCGQEVGVSSTSVYSGAINWSINPELKNKYTNLLACYNSNEALRKATPETFTDNDVVVFKKTYYTSTMLVLVNTRSTEQTFEMPAELQGKWQDALHTDAPVTLGVSVILDPYEYLILSE